MTIRLTTVWLATLLTLVCTVSFAGDRESGRGERATSTSKVVPSKENARSSTAPTTTAPETKASRTEPTAAKPVQSDSSATYVAKAPQAGEQINWHVISGGGGEAVSANYALSGTLGQTAVGFSSSPNSQCLAGFWQDFGNGGGSCCVGRVGNANGLGGDEPTIGDISVLIDAKFITGTCDGIIACLSEADINQSGGSNPTCNDITIGDISMLIDYLFITGPTLGLHNCL